jgi:RNA polymerase sigma-70 factor (ECF subfamily)
MVPAPANGQPAVVAYLRGEPYAVAVLTVRGDRLHRIAVFAEPPVVARFVSTSAGRSSSRSGR